MICLLIYKPSSKKQIMSHVSLVFVIWCPWSAGITGCYYGNTSQQVSVVTMETWSGDLTFYAWMKKLVFGKLRSYSNSSLCSLQNNSVKPAAEIWTDAPSVVPSEKTAPPPPHTYTHIHTRLLHTALCWIIKPKRLRQILGLPLLLLGLLVHHR